MQGDINYIHRTGKRLDNFIYLEEIKCDKDAERVGLSNIEMDVGSHTGQEHNSKEYQQ